ncbi:MAG: hypothetical protein OES47_09450 [Acidobacteriota bacterium]|nr:hypothetical protein [Acidobacteriota bacterium]
MVGSLSNPRRLVVRRCGACLVAFLGVTWAGSPLCAFETDQYLAADVELADSAGAINDFINSNVELVLDRVNGRNPEELECEDLPPRIYRRLFQNMLSSRLRRFVKTSGEIDRFPSDDVGGFGYTRRSIYRRPAFPFIVPLSRTIQVGEVRFGIDKFGHVFGFGRRYYTRYRKHLQRGLSEEEALRRVVGWGLMMERYFVGGYADGVFSYADLEANFQGLRLARGLCEGPRPHLEQSDGLWRLTRVIELQNYVNHDFDESINNNHYVGHRWTQVRPMLVKSYCSSFVSGEMRPAKRTDPSLSARIVAAHFSSKGREPQQRHSLTALCDPNRGSKRESVEIAAH